MFIIFGTQFSENLLNTYIFSHFSLVMLLH